MKYAMILLCSFFAMKSRAQKIDSIAFHLYTDSLKRGTYNYINVDAHMSDGTWLPLTEKDIEFVSSAGKFDKTCLVLDRDFTQKFVTVRAVLKADSLKQITRTIYIKQIPDPDVLPGIDEVMQSGNGKKQRRKG
jgi:hypothetical protein